MYTYLQSAKKLTHCSHTSVPFTFLNRSCILKTVSSPNIKTKLYTVANPMKEKWKISLCSYISKIHDNRNQHFVAFLFWSYWQCRGFHVKKLNY